MGLCLGIVGVLVVCYLAFASPHVIARWTGASYLAIIAVIMLVLCLFALLLAARPHWLAALTPGVVLLWNVLLVLSLVVTILSHQLSFPAAPSGYPLAEPPVTWLHLIPLFATLILLPVILIDWALFVQALVAGKPSSRVLGAGFSLGSLYLLFMIFAHVFTTVYDYIPVVGPFFRDRFWLVYLVAGIVLTLPVLLVGSSSSGLAAAGNRLRVGKAFPALMAGVAVATVAGAILTAAQPAASSPAQTSLRILTYNIQQGYCEAGLKNFDGQLDLIRQVDADIVGLQESDTARIAGGNADVVRYFADRLDMHSYYGPKTVPGTFGIALLSKVPIQNPRTFYMYSEGEQTAAIEAQVTVGGKTYNVFVTHLGNDGPIVQQEAILQEVEGKANVILMGDFNFRPDTEQYRLTTGMLADSWLLRWPQGNESQGIDPIDRIDHIFVSPGTKVVESEYLSCPESDHPAMTTVIEL
jgi:endonuclease/exonuclease/phosphatase family metal-dependent hydrolase